MACDGWVFSASTTGGLSDYVHLELHHDGGLCFAATARDRDNSDKIG